MFHPMDKSYVQPGRAEVHFDQALTDVSHAYIQDPNAFVADRVFSILPVSKPTNKYFLYDKGDFNRDEMKLRAPSTESAGSSYRISNDSYDCEVWALHRDVDDQVRATADSPLSMDRDAALYLTQKGLLRKEVLWGENYFQASLWDADLIGVNAAPTGVEFLQWDDILSTPIEDVQLGREEVHEATGLAPNKFVLGRKVYNKLLLHPDIVDRLNRGQTSGPAIATRQNLAALFEVDEILVMDAVQNTAAEGQASVMSYIGGKSALLLHVPATPGLMTPAAGYTFSWTGLLGGGALSSRIGRMRAPLIKSDRFEIEMAFDQKLAASDLGKFFRTAIA